MNLSRKTRIQLRIISYLATVGLGILLHQKAEYVMTNYELVSPIQHKMLSPLPKSKTVITPNDYVRPTLTSTPTITVSPTPSVAPTKKAIERTLNSYHSPMTDMASVFAAQVDKYPLYKKYPYLLPAIFIKETSAGKSITYTNNCMNWGIHTDFKPESCAESIERAASGIAERSSYYAKFRETQDLNDFVAVYAPPTSNNTNLYHSQLISYMNDFKSYEK